MAKTSQPERKAAANGIDAESLLFRTHQMKAAADDMARKPPTTRNGAALVTRLTMVFQNLALSLSSRVPKYHSGSWAKKAPLLLRKWFLRYSGRRADSSATSDTVMSSFRLLIRCPKRSSRERKKTIRTNGTGDLMKQATDRASRAAD